MRAIYSNNLHGSVLSTGISLFFFSSCMRDCSKFFFRYFSLARSHPYMHKLLVMVFMQQMLQNDVWTDILTDIYSFIYIHWYDIVVKLLHGIKYIDKKVFYSLLSVYIMYFVVVVECVPQMIHIYKLSNRIAFQCLKNESKNVNVNM